MRVVATAGHVDHGKSALVHVLTGTDPDRWAMEKDRGMTIDIGFGATVLPSGAEIGFVDVPGHAGFVKKMLAGTRSIDACMFVVAVTEGWKAQSEEHLRILDFLGVSRGVIALTKVDSAAAGLTDFAAMDIQDRVAGTFLERAAIIPVSARTGAGIDELRRALDSLLAQVPRAEDRGRPRLWIDRAFAVNGSGTVVTGTLTGGRMRAGDEMIVQPGGHNVRIRSLESHNHRLTAAEPGRRLAGNLVGVHHKRIGRGQAVIRGDQWHLTTCFDATLSVLSRPAHPVGRKGAYALHTGSGEFPVRLRLLRAEQIEPGMSGLVRVRLRTDGGIPLSPGDRYVLREAGRSETVGGGEVLDVEPILPASRAVPSRSVERVVSERGWVETEELFRLTGLRLAGTVGRWVVDAGRLVATQQDVLERCERSGSRGVDLAAFDARQRAVIAQGLDDVELKGGRVYLKGRTESGLSRDGLRVLRVLESGGLSPPAFSLGDRGALRELERAGMAVQSEDAWFAAKAIDDAISALGSLLTHRPEGFTVADARDYLGSSRRYILPLLGHLDSIGVTARRGNLRVAGRRLNPGRANSS